MQEQVPGHLCAAHKDSPSELVWVSGFTGVRVLYLQSAEGPERQWAEHAVPRAWIKGLPVFEDVPLRLKPGS